MLRFTLSRIALALIAVSSGPLAAEEASDSQAIDVETINLDVNSIVLTDDGISTPAKERSGQSVESADPDSEPVPSIVEDVLKSVDAAMSDVSAEQRERILTAIRENELLQRAEKNRHIVERELGSVGRMFIIGPDGKKVKFMTAGTKIGLPNLNIQDIVLDATWDPNHDEFRDRVEAMRLEIKKRLGDDARVTIGNIQTQKHGGKPDPSKIVATGRVVIVGPDGEKQEFRIGNKDGDFKSYQDSLKTLEGMQGVPKGVVDTLRKTIEASRQQNAAQMTLQADSIRLESPGNAASKQTPDTIADNLDMLLDRMDALEKKVESLGR